MNEIRLYLKGCARNYGRGYTSVRVRHPYHYKRDVLKMNVSVAIDPGKLNVDSNTDRSSNQPRR